MHLAHVVHVAREDVLSWVYMLFTSVVLVSVVIWMLGGVVMACILVQAVVF